MVEETLTIGDTEVVVRETDSGFEVEKAEESDMLLMSEIDHYSDNMKHRAEEYGLVDVIPLSPLPFELMIDGDDDVWLVDSDGECVSTEGVAHYSSVDDVEQMVEDLVEKL